MAFFASSGHTEVAALYDIGSASVGAALVRFRRGEAPHMLYATRVPIQFQQQVNAKRFVALAATALGDVSEQLVRIGLPQATKIVGSTPRIKNVLAVFSSPWLMSKTHITQLKKDKPFVASPTLIQDIVADERKMFAELFARESKRDGAVTIIEDRVIGMHLNGYEVQGPDMRSCTELSLAVFLSAAPTEAIETIKSAIHKIFNFRKLALQSFPLVYFSTVRDIQADNSDFMCIDITGEVTDIILSRHGIIVENSSFPIGKHHFARAVAAAIGISAESALSYLNMSASDNGKVSNQQISSALASAQQEWTKSFVDTISSFATRTLIPRSAFVTADPEVGKHFASLISEIEFDTLGMSKEKFKTTYLGPDEIGKYVEREPGVSADAFLMIESAFFNKMIGSTTS
jgi:hypothetical protein